MAISNLKARIERLERQQGPTGTDPLIVVIRHFDEFEEGHGVRVDGVFYACPPGMDLDVQEATVIREINSDASRNLLVVTRSEPLELA